MQRIEGQVEGSRELAKQVLYWIASAIRPLTTTELQIALAVEMDTMELDLENLPQVGDIVSVCAGLVAVNKDSNTIHLVHFTTQTYFEQTWSTWFSDAQRTIVLTLITYLSYEGFNAGFYPTDEAFEKRLKENPLYNYAAHNWGHHARGTSMEKDPLILKFLENRAKVTSTGQLIFYAKNFARSSVTKRFYSQDAPTKVAGIHLVASFGLIETTTKLLEVGCDPNTDDGEGGTPIFYAVHGGHHAVVSPLLQKGVDPRSCFDGSLSLLSLAAIVSDKATVRLFLDKGVDPNHKSLTGSTALLLAAEAGHETALKLLPAGGADH
jgi:Ankyrin repeats (3 copies)